MQTIRRAMIAGALALPLTLGTAGIASADTGVTFEESTSWAGSDGAGIDSTYSIAGSDGNTTFEQNSATAGPDGASSSSVNAGTYGHNNNYNNGYNNNGYNNGYNNNYNNGYNNNGYHEDDSLLGGLLGTDDDYNNNNDYHHEDDSLLDGLLGIDL
jgi:hypothetical protein